MQPELSQLVFHSFGAVSQNKEMGTTKIVVIPIEHRMFNSEEIIDADKLIKTTVKTADGDIDIDILVGNSIKADWLNFNSNRVTAPDVRRGDQVIIMRLGNTDVYYWQDLNLSNVKRLETAIYAFSADPTEPMRTDLSNAYVLEVSSHNRTITLKTSKANGELCTYIMQFTGKSGMYTVEDDLGNEIYMDSKNTNIGLKNALETAINLNKKDIIMYAPGDISHTAVGDYSIDCNDYSINCKAYTLNCKGAILNTTSGTVTGPWTFKDTVTVPKLVAVDIKTSKFAGGSGELEELTATMIEATLIKSGKFTNL